MTKKQIAIVSELPAWLDLEAWKGFVEMRKTIKHPMTERAQKLTLQRLEDMRKAGHDPNRALDQSTELSYRGVFEPKPAARVVNGQQSFAERDRASKAARYAEMTGKRPADDRNVIDMEAPSHARIRIDR